MVSKEIQSVRDIQPALPFFYSLPVRPKWLSSLSCCQTPSLSISVFLPREGPHTAAASMCEHRCIYNREDMCVCLMNSSICVARALYMKYENTTLFTLCFLAMCSRFLSLHMQVGELVTNCQWVWMWVFILICQAWWVICPRFTQTLTQGHLSWKRNGC